MKIVFFGDSITDMGRNRDVDGSIWSYGFGYPFVIKSRLSEEDPTKHELINRGISGNRTVDLYARIKTDVWNLQPDVLSILIGANDVWHELNRKDGVELERFERVYQTIIEETKERLPNIKIILMEPFVLSGSETEAEFEKFEDIKIYAKTVKKLAEKYQLPFVKLQDKFDVAAKEYGAEYYLYDGVHPHIAGATLIANEWLKVFKSEIEK